jgi:hypothetical protein
LRKRPKETSEISNLTEVTTTATEAITMRGAAFIITTVIETITMMIGMTIRATAMTETITMIGTSSTRVRGEATFQRVG